MYYYYQMNNLPESIINKIMLYNSHPIADIIEESTIFNYMEIRLRSENKYMLTCRTIHLPGGFKTAFDCGTLDSIYLPRKRIRINGKYNYTHNLTEDEKNEYKAGYLHHPRRRKVRLYSNDEYFLIFESQYCSFHKKGSKSDILNKFEAHLQHRLSAAANIKPCLHQLSEFAALRAIARGSVY